MCHTEQLILFSVGVDGCSDPRANSRHTRLNQEVIVRFQPQSLRGWPRERLTQLFQNYNRCYWGGRLPQCTVECARVSGEDVRYYGWTASRRLILIDPVFHENEADIRETLLHEMVHVAVGFGAGHGTRFLYEIERLMREGAPISFHHALRYARLANRLSARKRFDYLCEESDLRRVEYREFLRPPRDVVPLPNKATRIRECFCSDFCTVFKSERSSIFCRWALEELMGLRDIRSEGLSCKP